MTTTGEIIGPYILGECLGQGGFGAVYAATHQETGQRVAVKLLHGSKEMEPDVQNRFVREVALLKRLEHPNIVQIFEAGLHDGSIYCSMELVECGTLNEVLDSRILLPWRDAAEVALQICEALAHAHARGCVHRDLKPANLYLSEDGKVKLGDLGLARDLENSRLTAEGQTVGTWRYMPPEQIMGEESIDGRLDLYALGCILFEMVAGRVPFDGPDFATIFDQHLEAAPPRLNILVSDCPQAMADLVAQLLEKEPANRPNGAQAVADRLRAILIGKITAEPPSTETASDFQLDSEFIEQGPNLTRRLQGTESTSSQGPNWRVLGTLAAILALAVAILLAILAK
ncbi:MAG: serine/threonine protein kinase [Pirellulales bacterium]|nr:serine/threonine protein kinase [Pirellulales bacterium]